MDNKSTVLKRLNYKSCHRGCKETDILLGNFAKYYLYLLNNEELSEYERLLELDDIYIYNWFIKNSPLPITFNTSLLYKINEYTNANSTKK